MDDRNRSMSKIVDKRQENKMRIRLAILDSDKNYLSRLSVVFTNKYADKIEFYSFTDEKMAVDNVNTGKIDVLLANANFLIDVDALSPKCAFAYIVETTDVDSVRNQVAIGKYQRADLFYKQILSLYAEKAKMFTGYKMNGSSNTRMISFVSFSGGSGSSTAAASFAVYAAKQGKKVLYLNVERVGSTECFFEGQGQFNFSDIVYAIKSKKGNISLKLESCVKQDASGVYFYSSPEVALDLAELDTDELLSLIEEMGVAGEYDYIIVDSDFEFSEKVLAILAASFRVVFVNDGMEISNIKFENGYRSLQVCEQQKDMSIISKSYLFYNKFSNKMSKTIQGLEIQELGGVPKFENATAKQIVEQISTLTEFGRLLETWENTMPV